ncbi:MAG TPA: hypothetical protein VNI20_09815 [Fimbriimonadaceae bacterium]|nr:hypothetical protein [Fimbriimonadaceae bacterium]
MISQPIFPEPIQVAGNVAGGRYGEIVLFIRKTMLGHCASVGLVCLSAVLFGEPQPIKILAIIFVASLLALTAARRFLKGGTPGNFASILLLAPTIWSLGGLVRYGWDAGLPVWILASGYLCALIYGLVSGKDFSFVGQFVITTVVMAIILPSTVLLGAVRASDALLWGCVTLAYVFFFVYDLAALLSRRRPGEAVAAVADLYRDLLNFVTYSVRIALHWRRFRFI